MKLVADAEVSVVFRVNSDSHGYLHIKNYRVKGFFEFQEANWQQGWLIMRSCFLQKRSGILVSWCACSWLSKLWLIQGLATELVELPAYNRIFNQNLKHHHWIFYWDASSLGELGPFFHLCLFFE